MNPNITLVPLIDPEVLDLSSNREPSGKVTVSLEAIIYFKIHLAAL